MADAVKCARCDRLISSDGVKSCNMLDCVHLIKPDLINHPPHYRAGEIYETIRVIEAWELGYNLGCCIKYISRCGKKDNHLQDLEKARWYLTREIDSIRAAKALDHSPAEVSKKDGI